MVSNIEISNTPQEGKLKYGATFASSQKDAGMKTDIGRNILTSVLTKLPFIETIGGYRISGARQDRDWETLHHILIYLLLEYYLSLYY